MEVRDIMTAPAIAVGQDENVTAAVRLLRRYNLGALPVCDGAGRLRGMVTDRDIALRCFSPEEGGAQTRISEIMSRGIVTAAPGDSVETAARTMAKERVRRLPVTENGRLVGMVSLCDMARRRDCREVWTAAMQSISANISRT